MKGIPLPLLLALVAASAKVAAERAGAAPQAEACDCPGCKFRKATDDLLAARQAYAVAEAKAAKLTSEARAARAEQDSAHDALLAAQAAFDKAADALNAEEAAAL